MKKRLLLSIVIPTKDREKLLLKSLNYLSKNIFLFNEVIIIDSSLKKIDERSLKKSYKKMNIKYFTSQPSTSMQRNLCLKSARKKK